ncbi:MAG TPA: hypothetical protein VFU27_07390, partial [Terriglobales bacterium]|nr:hypothetical protein [Terriglobales bacterium]
LGAVLYEMLTGQRAFKGETPADTLTAILSKDPPELATSGAPVPPLLENIVRHCLEKRPEERFQSASDIVFDLQQITLACSSTLRAQSAPAKLNWRYGLGALAVLALIAGGLLLGRYAQAPSSSPRFQQLTYHRGTVSAARFLPDGHSVVYSAAWNGSEKSLYTARTDIGGETPLGTDGEVLSINASGELLVLRNERPVFAYARVGELDRVPVSGGGPRPIADAVQDATWAPDGSIAAVRYVNQHYRLEYPLGKPLLQTAGFLRAPRISPLTGQVALLFHPNFGDDYGSVALVERDGHLRELTPYYATINGLAWSPAGNELWFSAMGKQGQGGAIYAVSMNGKIRTLLSIPNRIGLLDAAPDGAILIANLRETETAMFSAPELPADRDVAVSIWTTVADISPDGQYLLLCDETTQPYTVVVAKSDGSLPIRLGKGNSVAISPDAKWVLAASMTAPQQYFLLPMSAGEPQQISHDQINRGIFAFWLPDSRHFVFSGSEPGHKSRGYMQDIAGGLPRPVTPEGFSAGPVSPDGKHFITIDENGTKYLQSFEDPSSRIRLNIAPSDLVHGWLDATHVYVYPVPLATEIYRLDVFTGKRELLKRIAVPDKSGVQDIVPVRVARDGKHFLYGVGRSVSDLHLVRISR